jgi:hypothetical protein
MYDEMLDEAVEVAVEELDDEDLEVTLGLAGFPTRPDHR